MATVKFRNPTDIPAYNDWDFSVEAAEIILSAVDLRAIYRAYSENHRRYYSNINPNTPRYAEAQRIEELCVLLDERIASDVDIELDGHDYVWSFASALMFEQRFISALCPACDVTFSPEACSVESWSYGEGLVAEGGRRVRCPRGHTLYSCGEWNS